MIRDRDTCVSILVLAEHVAAATGVPILVLAEHFAAATCVPILVLAEHFAAATTCVSRRAFFSTTCDQDLVLTEHFAAAATVFKNRARHFLGASRFFKQGASPSGPSLLALVDLLLALAPEDLL